MTPFRKIDPVLLGERIPGMVEKVSAFPEVAAIWLFGSVARGRPRATSDVDIAVFTVPGARRRDPLRHMEYFGAASKALGTDRLDVVILNSAPVTLRHEVFRNGKLLFLRDAAALARFREASMREYEDTAPLRSSLREAYFRRIREHGFGRRPAHR
jgi:hypothetical protein